MAEDYFAKAISRQAETLQKGAKTLEQTAKELHSFAVDVANMAAQSIEKSKKIDELNSRLNLHKTEKLKNDVSLNVVDEIKWLSNYTSLSHMQIACRYKLTREAVSDIIAEHEYDDYEGDRPSWFRKQHEFLLNKD